MYQNQGGTAVAACFINKCYIHTYVHRPTHKHSITRTIVKRKASLQNIVNNASETVRDLPGSSHPVTRE